MNSLPNYEIVRVIGSGCFGYVFEAIDKNNNRKVALKRIQKVGTQLSREYEILFQVKDCSNIVKILDFFYSRTQNNKLIQNIIFEHVETNLETLLESHIKKGQHIPEETIKSIMFQVLTGLEYIHLKQITHRDLKPENILLSEEGQVKICDFGSSKIVDQGGKNTPYIVSRYYRAIQLILCITNYTTAIDIWAAGCILGELFLLRPLFKGKSEGDQLFAILKILGSFTNQEKSEFLKRTPFEKQMINEIGHYSRTDLKQLFLMVEDFTNFKDLFLKMLAYLPQKRITAAEALKHPFFNSVRGKHKRS